MFVAMEDTRGCSPCAVSGCWSGRESVSVRNKIFFHVSPEGQSSPLTAAALRAWHGFA